MHTAGGSPWVVKASTPRGPDALVLYGVFDDGTAPVLGDYGVEGVIGPVKHPSSGTAYTVDGSTTGTSVPAGETRALWIRLDMPTTTTTVSEQTLRVEITASPP